MARPQTNLDFQLATFAGGTAGLATLARLGIFNPHPIWIPGVSVAQLGNNQARLLGAPTVVWGWGFLPGDQRDILRAYCPGASADVFIVSPTSEVVSGVGDASQRYQAIMVWPSPGTPEDPNTNRRLQFSITFRQLVGVL